jgi:hypothetical protein
MGAQNIAMLGIAGSEAAAVHALSLGTVSPPPLPIPTSSLVSHPTHYTYPSLTSPLPLTSHTMPHVHTSMPLLSPPPTRITLPPRLGVVGSRDYVKGVIGKIAENAETFYHKFSSLMKWQQEIMPVMLNSFRTGQIGPASRISSMNWWMTRAAQHYEWSSIMTYYTEWVKLNRDVQLAKGITEPNDWLHTDFPIYDAELAGLCLRYLSQTSMSSRGSSGKGSSNKGRRKGSSSSSEGEKECSHHGKGNHSTDECRYLNKHPPAKK